MPGIVKECLLGLNFLALSSEEMSKKKYTKVKGKRNLKITIMAQLVLLSG